MVSTPVAHLGWRGTERILVAALMLVFLLGTPGLGIETRDVSKTDAVAGAAYGVAFFAVLASLIASFRWPVLASWLGFLGGGLSAAVTVLDLAGAFVGPPPIGMAVVDVAVAILGAAVVWRSWAHRSRRFR